MRTPAALAAAVLATVLAAALAAGVVGSPPGAVASPTRDSAGASSARTVTVHLRPQSWEAKVVALTNARRKAHGVKPLRASSCAHRFAAPWARHLARKSILVHHLPLSPLFRCVRHPHAAGENIAEGYQSPRAVVAAWMSDKGHRDNLLNPRFTRIAVAGAHRVHGATYAVQDFAG